MTAEYHDNFRNNLTFSQDSAISKQNRDVLQCNETKSEQIYYEMITEAFRVHLGQSMSLKTLPITQAN